MSKNIERKEYKGSKTITRTMMFGYVFMFIAAGFSDNGDCGPYFCSPWPFIVIISLFVGYCVTLLLNRFMDQ